MFTTDSSTHSTSSEENRDDAPHTGSIANLDFSTLFASARSKGGEGGKGEASRSPPPPPSPPSPPSNRMNVVSVDPNERGDDVYRPAVRPNPVIEALRKENLYRKAGSNQRHEITCPWQGDHSDDQRAAIYVEPNEACPSGRFECSKCPERRVHDVIERLGVDPTLARCKPLIRNVKGEMHRVVDAAERVLAKQPDYFHSGETIVRIKREQGTGDVTTEPVSEQALAIILSAATDFEGYDGRTKTWSRIDVPPRILQSLIKKGQFNHLRSLNGLARQPFFRRGTDALVRTSGYDATSAIFSAFEGSDYNLPEPTKESAENALNELDGLLAEFHFAHPADKAAAICGMLTASIRSSLPLSPAFSISASRPGSGKSFLASLIACFGGPGGPHNTSYPTSTEEASKLALSLMMSSPAVVCFDDMVSDWVAFAALNRMLTSETISDRILGTNRVATARTATLIMGTGNNIRPLRDMARRVVSVYLSPRVQDITSLRYSGDPVAKVKANRAQFVGYALTIVSAYIAAGKPHVDVPNVPSYGQWSKLCRESLVWLGQPDPAESLISQVNDDPDVQLFGELLAQWYECFGEKQTMVRTVVEKAEHDSGLKEALFELPIADRNVINRSKLGRFLARHANRIVNGLELRQSPTGERNAWTVVAIDEDRKTQPSSARPEPFEPARAWTQGIAHPNGGAAPGETF